MAATCTARLLSVTIGQVSGQRRPDGDAHADGWRQTVEALWDEVAQLRDAHNADRRRQDKPPVTNKEIAEKIGVSDRTLGDWLRKRSVVPDWYEIRKLVEYLGGDAATWQPRWERAKAAYDRRPRARAPRNDRPASGAEPAPADPDDPVPRIRAAEPTSSAAAPEPPGSWRRWRRPVAVAVLAMLIAAAGLTAVLILSPGRPARPVQPTSSPRVWHATIVNTWSSSRSKDVGVFRYRSPLRPERELPGHFSGDSISIVCQYRQGRMVTDSATGQSSAVWDQLVDGSWLPDLYIDLPKVSGERPPMDIPTCRDVS